MSNNISHGRCDLPPRRMRSRPDHTSWALMERLAITDALALDADFRIYRYGPGRRQAFTVLP